MRKVWFDEGHPEVQKGNLGGFYSVHIDEKNRIVFRITDEGIEISQCGSHYGNQ